ncbi:Protein SEY1 [Candida viswanathii]|uniref:Protein SEY1 n=1 Tax=Candida viswanathii TaxID=5486 RepID=A0A367YDN2_9ASCO|nr:Protein SEY1 [Candida viswanathii]
MSSELSEGELSQTSSSSSFVPVDQRQLQDAIQIINEDKKFNQSVLDYINKTAPADVGNNYHIISVFGSQSTGKSTLLNKLFNTNFDVMDELNRQQTTKGIWLAFSPVVSTTSGHTSSKSNILVMDVEAALFALSTSEILIINIWETQVGLYQGANMGLLKTVFEVNLSLFGKSKLEKTDDHKVLLLIVIRDHVGVTPVESLAKTFTLDLISMWSNLAKPAELEHLEFSDFFDVDFHALNHKVLQPKEFAEGIKSLEIDWLSPKSCLSRNTTTKCPLTVGSCIRVTCDELSIACSWISCKFGELFGEPKPNPDYEQLGALFIDLRNDTLENYDISASRYNKSVYEQKGYELNSIVNKSVKKLATGLSKAIQAELGDQVLANTTGFWVRHNSGTEPTAIDRFKFKSWTQFYELTHKLISKEKLLVLLQDRFDDIFRYDENGLPKLYLNEADLEKTSATGKTGSLGQVQKEVDAKYIETKRSIVQHITQIPYYIYLIIVFLGWNEFMAVIRNPLLFSLALLLGASVFILYKLNLLKPAIVVAQRTLDEAVAVGKEKLRESWSMTTRRKHVTWPRLRHKEAA